MNSTLSPWNELPARLLRSVGVYRHGIASLRQVDDQALRQYTDWLSRGMHAGMDYLERYPDIRRDPRMLLDGATTVISCAFPYFTPISRTHGTANIALYALGTDYHEVVRNRLEQAAEAIRDTFGGQTRVCVDTAPLRERYWALHSGLGFIGTNNHLIIPGAGSYFFLGEILTTAPFRPTPPLPVTDCGRCGHVPPEPSPRAARSMPANVSPTSPSSTGAISPRAPTCMDAFTDATVALRCARTMPTRRTPTSPNSCPDPNCSPSHPPTSLPWMPQHSPAHSGTQP